MIPPSPSAALLAGHALHAILLGGAVVVAVAVYAVGRVTAPTTASRDAATPSRAAWQRRPLPRSARRVAVAQQVVALGLCGAAGMHLSVMPAHVREAWLYGAFFATVAAVQLALAWRVLSAPRRAELAAALGFSVTIVVLWATTRTIGVPVGPRRGVVEALGLRDGVATGCELLGAAALGYLITRAPDRALGAAWPWSLWPAATRLLLATTLVGVPVVSLLAPSA